MSKRVFVTVGSTKFDALIQSILSSDVLYALRTRGYTKLMIQCGDSSFSTGASTSTSDSLSTTKDGVDIDIWRFKSSLEDYFREADLVISHAGSGTIIEVLRMHKPLIVVPNPTLLDNHQEELANALERKGHLKSSSVLHLATAIREFDTDSTVPFPEQDGSKFRGIVDQRLGYKQ